MEASENSQSFATCYMELCKEQKVRPLPAICVTLPHSLDLTTDRVKMDDWGPILNSLSLDQTLKLISIRSRYPCKKALMENVNSVENARRAPVALTPYLLEWLSHSLAQCLRNSLALMSLELEGIPLSDDCLATLCLGLAATKSLQHLSLQRCHIGDKSCALVCRTIGNVQSVRSLNLSQCDLTSYSGTALATTLSRQKLLLYHDTWKASLRYREPDLDAMSGLRRLTLNNNPLLGDSAMSQLIEAIQDNLWLKALDVQHCGLTDTTGSEILHLLDTSNTTLEVIDLRSNANLNEEIIQQIFKKLEMNNSGYQSEYKLLKLPCEKVDNRILCNGAKRREHMSHHHQPKNKIIGNSKRIYQPRVATTATANESRCRVKTKPAIPHFTNLIVANDKKKYANHKCPMKPVLHLDLQTQINSALDDDTDAEENADKIDDDFQEEKSVVLPQQEEILNNEIKQMEDELKKEKTHRKLAEMKLDMMKRDLQDLENIVKAKETETRGYLLISEKFLDEIAKSFEELLRILDEQSGNMNSKPTDLIKYKVKYLLRKTKSEKQLEREILQLEPSTKLAKSSGDIGTSPVPVISQLEKKIGDVPDDVVSSKADQRLFNSSASSYERARQLFAQIINGHVILNLDNRIS